MGAYLSTNITSPQTLAAGGSLTGGVTVTLPAVGSYYVIAEQYSSALAFIPGSRSYLHQAVAGGAYANVTTNYSVWTRTAAVDPSGAITAALILPNTDCYLYLFLKQITSVITAGAFVVGTTYKILTIGTTDFTLVGAASNTVGEIFVATGVGAGTGTVCTTPNPDTDDTIDYAVVTLQSSAVVPSIDMTELVNLMITMMIVGMMMNVMNKMMK